MLLSTVPMTKAAKNVDFIIEVSLCWSGVSAPLVLLVAYLFHPVDVLTVLRFRDCDVRHRRCGRRSMPMLQAGGKPDHIAGTNFLDRPALALNPAEAGSDDQSLAERVCMPSGARAGFERDMPATHARRIACLEHWVDPDLTGEVFRWSLAGGLRAGSCDLHRYIPFSWRSNHQWLCGGGSDGCHRSKAAGGDENASTRDHGVS